MGEPITVPGPKTVGDPFFNTNPGPMEGNFRENPGLSGRGGAGPRQAEFKLPFLDVGLRKSMH